MKYFVANFKANISPNQCVKWLQSFDLSSDEKREIIVCPPFASLQAARAFSDHTSIGSQDVSKYQEGAYTGEVTVHIIEELVKYCLIGHSERKKYFGETLDDVAQKLKNVNQSKLKIILCLNNLGELETLMEKSEWKGLDTEKMVLVYEPSSAISGGGDFHPDSRENIEKTVGEIKQKLPLPVLYGGSVTEENIHNLMPENVDGVLVGQKSLDPASFAALVNNFPT